MSINKEQLAEEFCRMSLLAGRLGFSHAAQVLRILEKAILENYDKPLSELISAYRDNKDVLNDFRDKENNP